MGLFSFGADKSSSQSQQTSQGGSLGFGASFGQSFGQTGGQSTGFGQSFGQTFVDQAQSPFLDFLRNQAVGGFGQQTQQAGSLQAQLGGLGGQAGQLGQQAGALGGQAGQLGQAAQANPFLAQLQQQAGGNAELVAAQTQQLSDVLAQQFNEQINPAISRQATGLGQLGGGRQGVAQGAAIQGQQRALAQGVVGFQGADVARQQQAAQAGGALFGQGISQAGQFLGQQGGFLGQQQGFLGQQAGFAGQGFAAGFQPGQQLAQLIGGPTVLSQQGAFDQQQATQFGFDQSQQGAFNFDTAFNQSQSTSSSKAGGFNIGF